MSKQFDRLTPEGVIFRVGLNGESWAPLPERLQGKTAEQLAAATLTAEELEAARNYRPAAPAITVERHLEAQGFTWLRTVTLMDLERRCEAADLTVD